MPKDQKTQLDIPMQYITLTIENILKCVGSDGRGQNWMTKNDWREAIENSGLAPSCALILQKGV